jgi:hypothetical protein
MQQFFQDSIYLITYFGKPDLFIIFTANPSWDKIIHVLIEGQISSNRPDIVARVFRAKLKYLIHLIKNGQAFGICWIIIYTVKYQKRRLPYAHIIVFLHNDHAFSESE